MADDKQDVETTFAMWGRRLLFIGGIGILLAYQLPGKPEAGEGSEHVGSD